MVRCFAQNIRQYFFEDSTTQRQRIKKRKMDWEIGMLALHESKPLDKIIWEKEKERVQ